MAALRFSVVTPTYNRIRTLHRVYLSLYAQTFRDFEWIIIDDGSTDGTDKLIKSWEFNFPFSYHWQSNGGQHRAMNAGVRKASGELVLFFDSDDRCILTALERFDYHWKRLPDNTFANVSCLCLDSQGKIIGQKFPRDITDTHSLSENLSLGHGERWGVNRRDVLLEFPFPEYDGERFCPSGLVWNRIANKYSCRHINEALRIYESGTDTMTNKSAALRRSSPRATAEYYRELALSKVPLRIRLRAAINFLRFCLE